MEFLEEIKKLDYPERIKLLQNEEVLNKIFFVDKKYDMLDFSKVLEVYRLEDIIKYYDSDMLAKITKMYPTCDYFFVFYMLRNDPKTFENEMLKRDELKDLILFKCKEVCYQLSFSYDTVMALIEYIDKNNIDFEKTTIRMIIYNSFQTEELQEKFLNANIKSKYKQRLLSIFKFNVVSKYLKENNLHISNPVLFELLYVTSLEINSNLYETESFFDECIFRNDVYKTRELLERLKIKIDVDYFEKLFKKKKIKLLEESNNRELILEVVIDNFFEDSNHNVFLNIIELIEYNDKFNLLKKERLEFYRDLISIYKSDAQTIKDFYNKYKDLYKPDDYYDDIRLLKNDSYQRIKAECLKLEDLKKLKKRPNADNLDIYELNGEPFRILVSCRGKISNDPSHTQRNCYSLIGNENMRVFRADRIIYGYLDFNIANIIHVYEADSYSVDSGYIPTNYINRIRTSEEILKANHKSEIQIKNNEVSEDVYEKILPSYVICFDELDDKSIEAAKELNIPIILIDQTKYKKIEGNNNLTNYETEYTLEPGQESSVIRKRSNSI